MAALWAQATREGDALGSGTGVGVQEGLPQVGGGFRESSGLSLSQGGLFSSDKRWNTVLCRSLEPMN